jgi:hypothetical protein
MNTIQQTKLNLVESVNGNCSDNQRLMKSPNGETLCSTIDEQICELNGIDTPPMWANLVKQDNGSWVSLDGVVECNDNIDEETGFSPRSFLNDCMMPIDDCPLFDIYNANPSKRILAMKYCSPLSPDNVLKDNDGISTPCNTYAETFPKELYTVMANVCDGDGSSRNPFQGDDCMCVNPLQLL